MTATTFDTLGYVKALEEAGFTRQQAEAQATAILGVLRQYDEASRQQVSTKGDIQDVRSDILRLEAKIEKYRYDLLKWQLAIGLAVIAVVAKGFGWLGF